MLLNAQYKKEHDEYACIKAKASFYIEDEDTSLELKDLLKPINYIANISTEPFFDDVSPVLDDEAQIPDWLFYNDSNKFMSATQKSRMRKFALRLCETMLTMEQKYEPSIWLKPKKAEIKRLLSYYKKGNDYLLFLKAQYEEENAHNNVEVDFYIEDEFTSLDLMDLLKPINYIVNL